MFLFLAGTLTVSAQTFTYTGLDLKSEHVKKKNVYEWENFVMLNYSLGMAPTSSAFQHSFGLTYGRVKLFGWYVNVMMSPGFHYGYTYESWYGEINGVYPFYTGKTSRNRISLTGGAIVRMVIPMYLYLGAGYGYQSLTREISNGEWVMARGGNAMSYGHCMTWDIGLQGNIKGFTISAGYSVMTDYDFGAMHEVKLGLGYTFKDKKK